MDHPQCDCRFVQYLLIITERRWVSNMGNNISSFFCVCLKCLEAGLDGRSGHPAVVAVEEGHRFDAELAKIRSIA